MATLLCVKSLTLSDLIILRMVRIRVIVSRIAVRNETAIVTTLLYSVFHILSPIFYALNVAGLFRVFQLLYP